MNNFFSLRRVFDRKEEFKKLYQTNQKKRKKKEEKEKKKKKKEVLFQSPYLKYCFL